MISVNVYIYIPLQHEKKSFNFLAIFMRGVRASALSPCRLMVLELVTAAFVSDMEDSKYTVSGLIIKSVVI